MGEKLKHFLLRGTDRKSSSIAAGEFQLRSSIETAGARPRDEKASIRWQNRMLTNVPRPQMQLYLRQINQKWCLAKRENEDVIFAWLALGVAFHLPTKQLIFRKCSPSISLLSSLYFRLCHSVITRYSTCFGDWTVRHVALLNYTWPKVIS